MSDADRGLPLMEGRHRQIQHDARRLALERLEGLEKRAHDNLPEISREIVRLLGEEGILRLAVPRAYGGATDRVEARALVAAREGVAYGSGLADALVALQGLGSLPLSFAGTDEQRQAWLPKVADGGAVAAFALTEPEAGSDAAAMQTTARRTGDGWELNGTKTFISNAGIADFYTLFAQTDPAAGHKGVTAFLVRGDAPGLKTQPLEAMAPHPLGRLELREVRLSEQDVVGAVGQGFQVALRTLDLMRPTVAAAAVGLAARALDESLARARSRVQFGRPIGDNQGLRWRLADAATELEAARLLVHRAAWLKDHGQERITTEAAQAKLFATEAAQRIVDLAVQVHGGRGVLVGSIAERLYREVRALRIYEGTSEILRDVIAKGLMLPSPKP